MILDGRAALPNRDKSMIFRARYSRGELDGVMMRALFSDGSAKKQRLLLETKESFPIAYVETHTDAISSNQHCRIFRSDMSLFAMVERVPGANLAALVHKGGS